MERVDRNFVGGSGTYGSLTTFQVFETSGVGFTQIANAKVPGTWQLTYGPSFSGGSLCLTFTTENRNVSLGSLERLNCVPRFFSFTASPDSVDALNPPAAVTFNGKGINDLYGTPVLAYYNEFGNIVASTSSGQLLYENGNVEGISVNVPDISQVYNGTYTVAVHNVNADGTWEIIGAATMNIYGNPPPPPTGGGGGDECGPPPPPDQPQLPCNQS
ncbi:MAG: hypothetical protein KIS76_15820 [Pyrinomonadaceae bacterium]|nr:hypothetical protein [Pyrinomonadaceae bacterium]